MTQNNGQHKKTENRIIRLKLIDKTLITGQINLNRNTINEHDRLSDLLTQNSDQFLVVFAATEMRDDLEQGIKHKTIFINKNHILWATPEEYQK